MKESRQNPRIALARTSPVSCSSSTASSSGYIGVGCALFFMSILSGCSGGGEGSLTLQASMGVSSDARGVADAPMESVSPLPTSEGSGVTTAPRDSKEAATAALTAAGATATANPVAAKAAPGVSRNPSVLGYNMDYPGDWTNVPPFIDQMKNARAIQGECSSADPSCDRVAHLDLDAGGWVQSLNYKDDPSRSYHAASVILNTSSERPDIGQTFAVTWQGKGDIEVHNGADVVRAPGENRLTFRLREGNTLLSLTNIDATDHLRDIRIFRPEYAGLLAAGEIFDPEMLAFLKPFGSVRFMDWMQSNAAGQCSGGATPGASCYSATNESCGAGGVCIMAGRWPERPTADQPSYQGWGQYLDNASPGRGTKVGGYPVETMVALANRAGADPHFNMPADYQDDYVRAFAEYVRDNLAPGLTASVEYSNEVWNWGFPQAQYANARGRELWPDEGTAWVQYAAGRTSNMCGIWKEVFASEEERVRCLISPQTGWRGLATTVLECPAWVASHPGSGPCYEHVDAINITGYFSGCLHDNEARCKAGSVKGGASPWTAPSSSSSMAA